MGNRPQFSGIRLPSHAVQVKHMIDHVENNRAMGDLVPEPVAGR